MNENETAIQLMPLLLRADIPEDAKSLINRIIQESQSPLGTDIWIYRAVVIILGICVLSTVLGGILLTILGKGEPKMALPEAIVAVGSAAIGALAGLLAPSTKK